MLTLKSGLASNFDLICSKVKNPPCAPNCSTTDAAFIDAYFNDVSTSPFVLDSDATNVEAKASPAPHVLTTVAGNSPQ